MPNCPRSPPAPLSDKAESLVGKLIWLPQDVGDYIRERSAERDERLEALLRL